MASDDAMDRTRDSESRSTLHSVCDSTRTFPRGIQPAAMARWSTPSTPSAASLCLTSFSPVSADLDDASGDDDLSDPCSSFAELDFFE